MEPQRRFARPEKLARSLVLKRPPADGRKKNVTTEKIDCSAPSPQVLRVYQTFNSPRYPLGLTRLRGVSPIFGVGGSIPVFFSTLEKHNDFNWLNDVYGDP